MKSLWQKLRCSGSRLAGTGEKFANLFLGVERWRQTLRRTQENGRIGQKAKAVNHLGPEWKAAKPSAEQAE